MKVKIPPNLVTKKYCDQVLCINATRSGLYKIQPSHLVTKKYCDQILCSKYHQIWSQKSIATKSFVQNTTRSGHKKVLWPDLVYKSHQIWPQKSIVTRSCVQMLPDQVSLISSFWFLESSCFDFKSALLRRTWNCSITKGGFSQVSYHIWSHLNYDQIFVQIPPDLLPLLLQAAPVKSRRKSPSRKSTAIFWLWLSDIKCFTSPMSSSPTSTPAPWGRARWSAGEISVTQWTPVSVISGYFEFS